MNSTSQDTLFVYPDHNLPFEENETAAPHFQLGGVIEQNNTLFAFHSQKSNRTQPNCTTIKKELLIIVEALKQFRFTLRRAPIEVYTDHLDLTHSLTLLRIESLVGVCCLRNITLLSTTSDALTMLLPISLVFYQLMPTASIEIRLRLVLRQRHRDREK
jgi:hypothetical protein